MDSGHTMKTRYNKNKQIDKFIQGNQPGYVNTSVTSGGQSVPRVTQSVDFSQQDPAIAKTHATNFMEGDNKSPNMDSVNS